MKNIAIATAACLLAATTSLTSHAADADTPRTRAEVIAELNEARASGWLTAHVSEDSGSAYLAQQRWVPQRSRPQVLSELKTARANGAYEAWHAEVGVEPPVLGQTSPLRYAGPTVGGAGPDGSGVHDTVVAHHA